MTAVAWAIFLYAWVKLPQPESASAQTVVGALGVVGFVMLCVATVVEWLA